MLAPADSPLKNPNYFEQIHYPLLASPKLDGIRCLIKRPIIADVSSDLEVLGDELGQYTALSRSLIALPSRQVQSLFSDFQELDGELIVGNETDHDVYNRTQSYVMSDDKHADDLKFRVFDCAEESLAGEPFINRLEYARDQIKYFNTVSKYAKAELVEHVICHNKTDVIGYEEWALEEGYEGVMLRNPHGHYKHNRGTFKEGLIYKLKREQDDEFVIIGFKEAKKNNNEATVDEKGYTKRSTSMSGLVYSGTLGKFVVSFNGVPIEVAPGAATHPQRKYIWDHQEEFLGRLIVVRHFPHGAKDLLRFPRFVGFKDKMNM
jgi:DNA ligase-1